MNLIFEIFCRIISPRPDELTLNRDKGVLRKLIPSNSNRQIQYTVKKYERNEFILFLICSNISFYE